MTKLQALRNTSGATIHLEKVTKYKKYIKSPKEDYELAINAYMNGETGKFGRYFALPNALVYRAIITNPTTKEQTVAQDIIAQDLNGHKIGNSSILGHIGRRVSFGNENLNRQVTPVQTALSTLIPMVPFSVFEQATLDIRTLEIVEQGPEETFKIKERNPKYKYGMKDIPETIIVDRHFTGARLIRVDGALFLFDVDRREVKHKIFNPFMAKIKDEVSTVAAAYDSLMPKEVKEAIKKGTRVHRQGEWFFIETKAIDSPDRARDWQGKEIDKRLELRAGNNRPNVASQCVEAKGLVRGKIEHSGREHAALLLKVWCKPVVNTAIESFTLSGDID